MQSRRPVPAYSARTSAGWPSPQPPECRAVQHPLRGLRRMAARSADILRPRPARSRRLGAASAASGSSVRPIPASGARTQFRVQAACRGGLLLNNRRTHRLNQAQGPSSRHWPRLPDRSGLSEVVRGKDEAPPAFPHVSVTIAGSARKGPPKVSKGVFARKMPTVSSQDDLL